MEEGSGAPRQGGFLISNCRKWCSMIFIIVIYGTFTAFYAEVLWRKHDLMRIGDVREAYMLRFVAVVYSVLLLMALWALFSTLYIGPGHP